MPAVPARVSTSYFATDPTEVRVSVCVVVRRNDGSREILLMRRSDNAHWGLPGGYVEPGESVTAAAAREVREETGFEIEIQRLVGVYSDPKSVVIDYGDRRRVQAINLCFEGVAKERGAKALVLIRRVDPNHRQVPVRSIRMGGGHLAHQRLEVTPE
jgi:ADP-ribose pyrophosphatase YjhB (NUDIX family)